MKQIGMAFILLLSGLMLMAGSMDPGLPDSYWDSPQATTAAAPEALSPLETDLRPEACAQCHRPQFDAWKSSLHAHAYSSGMVAQFPDMGHENANSCLQCHAPLAGQMYKDDKDMAHSIELRLQHTEGFDRNAGLTDAGLPLRHAGVTCAACHVRGWQRYGPPPKASKTVGFQESEAHGGFNATRDFEQSQFCASCHQFPQSMAINGKPLENTVEEWKQSSFAEKGITCQQCHMPDRRHEFRGIHDPAMVKKGLAFSLEQRGDDAVLAITSKWIGHAFPTYVTPKIIVRAEALDADGKIQRAWQWEIVREVYYNDGWQEKRDTRLMPGEMREFVATPFPVAAKHIHFSVNVIPDYFYKGVYQGLLSDDIQGAAGNHIQRAVKQADDGDYVLYEKDMELNASQ